VRRALLVLALFLAGPGTASAATEISFGVQPHVPRYGTAATFSGTVTTNGAPAAAQEVFLIVDKGSGTWETLGSVQTDADGKFAFVVTAKVPGSYAAATSSPSATSPAVVLKLRPRLTARITGLRYPGLRLLLRGHLTPARAGFLRVRVGTHRWRVNVGPKGFFRTRLPTRRPGSFTAVLRLVPSNGFRAVERRRGYRLRTPSLSLGSSGRAVYALERHLRELNYAIRAVNRFYGSPTYEAVLAFRKVHGMSRTGSVNRAFWRAFGRAHVPKARYSGSHIEVNKTKQVLFEVRRGKVVRVIHVSTGATGNTPVGRFRTYLKTPGLLPSGMYYSMFFIGAFAIHGYHSVPAYPASHGCVRIPMWLAPGLYSRWPLGTTVYIHYS
jgi:hypothetical protein